jgi:hypothetical protein
MLLKLTLVGYRSILNGTLAFRYAARALQAVQGRIPNLNDRALITSPRPSNEPLLTADVVRRPKLPAEVVTPGRTSSTAATQDPSSSKVPEDVEIVLPGKKYEGSEDPVGTLRSPSLPPRVSE